MNAMRKKDVRRASGSLFPVISGFPSFFPRRLFYRPLMMLNKKTTAVVVLLVLVGTESLMLCATSLICFSQLSTGLRQQRPGVAELPITP